MEASNNSGSADQPSTALPIVLLVDDEPMVLSILKLLLASDQYQIKVAHGPLEAIPIFSEGEIAVCVTDQAMPEMSGVEFLTLIRQQSPMTVCIMMTGTTDLKLAEIVVNQQLAHFFVTKPWDTSIFQNLIIKALGIYNKQKANPQEVASETAQLQVHEHARRAAFSLARAVDARDACTHSHSIRVSAFGLIVGEAMGLNQADLEVIRIGGLLHDLGKIGVPDEVLLKTGALTEKEFRYIKMHPIIGVSITEPIDFPWNITAIVRQHHENHNGSGYPTGIGGDEIVLAARIIHAVDAYEAMAADRVYRKALPLEAIESEFVRCRGTQFDPEVTDVFLELLHNDQFIFNEEAAK
ncbi:MAG: response regulator [Deltaproteobacteria bacterium]|nr:response regulator [Deltaproteobacteria bacterium]